MPTKKENVNRTYKKTKSKSTKKKRSKVKYPALDTNYTLTIRREATDYDYIDALKLMLKSDDPKVVKEASKALEFLNTFSEEYIGARFNHGKKILNKGKMKTDCYGMNNARNRCQYSRAISKKLVAEDFKMLEVDYDLKKDEYEDFLIELIDSKNNPDDRDEQD